MKTELEPLLLSVADVCRLLNISRSSFFSLRSCGKIGPQPIRLNRKVLFRRDEVKAWVRDGCPTIDKWMVRKAEYGF